MFIFPTGVMDFMLIKNRSFLNYWKMDMLMPSIGVTARVIVKVEAQSSGWRQSHGETHYVFVLLF